MKKPYMIGIGVVLVIALIFTIIILFSKLIIREDIADRSFDAKEYSKYYVLISEDMKTSFWQSVYESARTEAENNNIYLEQLGSKLSDDYSLEDYLRISIASKVDGIIISPDGSEGVSELINEAAKEGIPVITVLNDESDTSRVSFVGTNTYELGLTYGEQILGQLTENTENIYILFHPSYTNSANDVVFNQIKKKLNTTIGMHDLNIQPYYIADDNEFDSEEAIRDLFVNSDIVPDILVCMEEDDTESACQAIVDYNMVGEVNIIGSYSSEIELEAIQKKLIALTVAMDTEQLGRQSVQALLEYEEMGYVNNFYNVDLHIINETNVDGYVDSGETDRDE